jgi:hypothetical protein
VVKETFELSSLIVDTMTTRGAEAGVGAFWMCDRDKTGLYVRVEWEVAAKERNLSKVNRVRHSGIM